MSGEATVPGTGCVAGVDRPAARTEGGPARFEPRIVGFLCSWCAYAGADKVGAAQTPYSPNVSVVRLLCTGRLEPEFVLKAFERGADGVLVLGCHPGDCHYKEGNYRALQRHRLLLLLLGQLGIEPERCRFDCVSAKEAERFRQVIEETVEAVRRLGPLRAGRS